MLLRIFSLIFYLLCSGALKLISFPGNFFILRNANLKEILIKTNFLDNKSDSVRIKINS